MEIKTEYIPPYRIRLYDDLHFSDEMNQVDLDRLVRMSISEPRSRKLNAAWTEEACQYMQAQYGCAATIMSVPVR